MYLQWLLSQTNRGGIRLTFNERIIQEFQFVKDKYKGLSISENEEGGFLIKGLLEFSGSFNEISIEDSYFIEIVIPLDYPNHLPKVFEYEGRIPGSFHHYSDGSLCLGPPLKLKIQFSECASLLFFIEEILLSYLYSYSFLEKYGHLPFDQYSHDGKGLYEYYKEFFKIEEIGIIVRLLKMIERHAYRGHLLCPCGSKRKVRNCHGKILLQILELHSTQEISYERIYLEEFQYKELNDYQRYKKERKLRDFSTTIQDNPLIKLSA